MSEELVKFYAEQVKSLPITLDEKIQTLKKILEQNNIEWKEEYIDLLKS